MQNFENWTKKRKKIETQIRELSRNYNVSLELINSANDEQELTNKILTEYETRLEEIPAEDIETLLRETDVHPQKQKLKSLLLFAQQAMMLKEKAKLYSRLEESYNSLQQTNSQLKLKNEHYLNMLSFVSHELRTPLISILGYAELLDDRILGDLNEDQRAAIDTIVRSSTQLIDMIRNYLDLAKIESGKLKNGRVEVVYLKEHIIDPVLRDLEPKFIKHKMNPISSGVLDLKLRVDRKLIKIVFANLFDNAIKYGTGGTNIFYSVAEKNGSYNVSVENNGCGVEQNKISSIFEKFNQLAQGKECNSRVGAGLGLFISKKIIEEHGGRIWAESEAGKWFRVTVAFPNDLRETETGITEMTEDKIPLFV